MSPPRCRPTRPADDQATNTQETRMACNPIGWFEIYVNDMSRAKQFYESVLGLALTKLNDPTGSGIDMWAFPADMGQ
jgi:predicted enzyme related to lactoylglutathione lyase